MDIFRSARVAKGPLTLPPAKSSSARLITPDSISSFQRENRSADDIFPVGVGLRVDPHQKILSVSPPLAPHIKSQTKNCRLF